VTPVNVNLQSVIESSPVTEKNSTFENSAPYSVTQPIHQSLTDESNVSGTPAPVPTHKRPPLAELVNTPRITDKQAKTGSARVLTSTGRLKQKKTEMINTGRKTEKEKKRELKETERKGGTAQEKARKATTKEAN